MDRRAGSFRYARLEEAVKKISYMRRSLLERVQVLSQIGGGLERSNDLSFRNVFESTTEARAGLRTERFVGVGDIMTT
jgi:hypothetical protein